MQIIVSAVAAVCPQRLILRAADDLAVVVDDTAACYRAVEAGAGTGEILLRQSLAGELVGSGAVALLPVLCGQSTYAIDDVDKNSCAVCTETFGGHRIALEDFEAVLVGLFECFDISNDIELLAGRLHNDGLELLAAHDSAGAGTAGGTVLIVHDAGKENFLLACRADVQHGAISAVFGFEPVIQLFTENTEVLGGVKDLDLVVFNVEIAPFGSLSLNDQCIPAGELELCAPDTAGVGTCDHSCERGFSDDHIAAGGRGIGAGHGAGDVNELVFRGKRIYGGNALIIEDLGAEAAAADKFLSGLDIKGFGLDLTGAQVDARYFLIICAAHVNTSCYVWLDLKLTVRF